MAVTYAATGLTPQQWSDDYFKGYVRQNQFARYMGTDSNNIIVLQEDLTKKSGDSITFASLRAMTSDGVRGNQRLQGNEERLDSRSHRVFVDLIRNGTVVPLMEEQRSAIDLYEAARPALRDWSMRTLRRDIITALGSIDGVPYPIANATQKNAWLANNGDRVLFGDAEANQSPGDMATSLATVDATNDKLTPSAISLMRMMARRPAGTYDATVFPTRVNDDEEWYVLFCNSYAFRDLKASTAMQQALREAWNRGQENPLFRGGDLIYDGVVIREIPEIPVTGAVGANGARVGPVYMCGQQAVGIAWAQRSRFAIEDDDYKAAKGVAVSEIRGIEKLRFGTGANDTDNPVDNGVVTGFFSAAL